MPKVFTARNIVSVNPIQFVFKEGELVGLVVQAEVNYGEMAITHTLDIWEDLTETEQAKAKAVYNRIKSVVVRQFIGEG